MSQVYPTVTSGMRITDSRDPLLDRDNANKTCFSGTAFPSSLTTADIGMLCYRTDQDALYELVSVSSDVWVVVNNPMLRAIAALATNGIVVRTASGQAAIRVIQAPAAGISITNPDGVSGNPTLALANDLAAVEGLSGAGFAKRTGTDAWVVRSPAELLSDINGLNYGNAVVTGNTTLTASQMGSLILVNATSDITITLPNVWSSPVGILPIIRIGGTGTVTITNSGNSDVIRDFAGGVWDAASITLNGPAGESIALAPHIASATKYWAVITRHSADLFSNAVLKSAAFSLTAADAGIVQDCTGTWTITFPASATCSPRNSFAIRNMGSGTITFARTGTDTIEGATSDSLAAGESCIVYRRGTDWRLMKIKTPDLSAAMPKTGGAFTGAVSGTTANFTTIKSGGDSTTTGFQVGSGADLASLLMNGIGTSTQTTPLSGSSQVTVSSSSGTGNISSTTNKVHISADKRTIQHLIITTVTNCNCDCTSACV